MVTRWWLWCGGSGGWEGWKDGGREMEVEMEGGRARMDAGRVCCPSLTDLEVCQGRESA